MFWRVRCKIARIIARYCRDGAAFHQQTAMVVLVCEKSLRFYQVQGHGQESQNGRLLSWAETDHVVPVKWKRYIVGYLQFVEVQREPERRIVSRAAESRFSTPAPYRTAGPRKFVPVPLPPSSVLTVFHLSGIATPLKNGKEWFRKAILKLQNRLQLCKR